MEIKIDKIKINIHELDIQTYKNISIIPITIDNSTNMDILSLKKGLNMGIVEIKECEPSSVSEVIVINNAVTPLILVDGEEIKGANQNRIITTTMLIPAHTKMEVPVNCTEEGRWHYEGFFQSSEYFANSETRRAKSRDRFEEEDSQSTVWSSIRNLEYETSFNSKTISLNDNYRNLKAQQDEYLEHFPILSNQTGLIAIINNEVRGMELFYNTETYKEYHEKIIRSYVIDKIAEKNDKKNNTINIRNEIKNMTEAISNSTVKREKTMGLGEDIIFSNEYGTGSALIYEDNIIHMPLFKNIDEVKVPEQKTTTCIKRDFLKI